MSDLMNEITVISVLFGAISMAAGLIWLERRLLGLFQDRYGPNRVGPFGLGQVLADMIKIFMKEDWIPPFADKPVFILAPAIIMVTVLMSFAVIPFTPGIQVVNLNIGLLFFLAMSSMGAYSVVLAGWSSNNKYSLIGAMRSGAQIVSYELSAGLALLAVIVFAGSLSVHDIIQSQANGWWIIKGHFPVLFAFVVYVIASTAECNRAPFDLAEAESELTAGYHTEYSGMQFGMFYLTEYINMTVVSMIAATVFLGGWMPFHIPADWAHGFNHIMD
jgi:NADH-quinone oxidoreductase subunit H